MPLGDNPREALQNSGYRSSWFVCRACSDYVRVVEKEVESNFEVLSLTLLFPMPRKEKVVYLGEKSSTNEENSTLSNLEKQKKEKKQASKVFVINGCIS